jgi:hypothetical protein
MSTVFSTNGQRQVGAGEKREREGKRKQKIIFFNKLLSYYYNNNKR